MKIGQMRNGQRLILGAYGPKDADPVPIVWLKAHEDGRFISDLVLDRLNVNPPRSDLGNRQSYKSSCLNAFLNSDDDVFDAPIKPDNYYYNRFPQDGYHGFLHAFSDVEREVLNTMQSRIGGQDVFCRVRIPTVDEVFGYGLRLFNRKGFRTQAQVYENVSSLSFRYHYCQYLLASQESDTFSCVDSMGYKSLQYPANQEGIRPLIKLALSTEIEQIKDGVFQIKGGSVKVMKLPEPSGLFDFYFGLA